MYSATVSSVEYLCWVFVLGRVEYLCLVFVLGMQKSLGFVDIRYL